jgi:hypothetical protein
VVSWAPCLTLTVSRSSSSATVMLIDAPMQMCRSKDSSANCNAGRWQWHCPDALMMAAAALRAASLAGVTAVPYKQQQPCAPPLTLGHMSRTVPKPTRYAPLALFPCPSANLNVACVCWPAVNLPGTYYVLNDDGTPSFQPCPEDTYGPGFRKQRGCVPCPTGLGTMSMTGRSSSTACGK